MNRFLVVTAVMVEARGLARELGLARVVWRPWPCFADEALEVVPAGLRASRLRFRWPAETPALVVAAGTCGALDPALASAGNLVLPRAVLGLDGARVSVDAGVHARAVAAATDAGCSFSTDSLATVGDVVATPEAKAALRAATGAVAVDMESAIVLAAAADRGIPALVVRGVSDTARQSLPRELTALVDDAGRTSAVRAAVLMARRPALLGRAFAIQRGTVLALRSVATVIARLASG